MKGTVLRGDSRLNERHYLGTCDLREISDELLLQRPKRVKSWFVWCIRQVDATPSDVSLL